MVSSISSLSNQIPTNQEQDHQGPGTSSQETRHQAAETRNQLTRNQAPAHQLKKPAFFLISLLVLFLSVYLACLFGPVDIGADKVLGVFLNKIFGRGVSQDVSATVVKIIWDIRFPRVLLAAIVGASLALSGAAFQGVLINPLADPFTIGVASGAAFGATIAIFLGGAFHHLPLWLQGIGTIPVFSFIGALGALFFVILFSRLSGGMRRETMILSGIVVATFLSALISLMKALDEESVQAIVFWIMGSLQGRSWPHIVFATPYMLLGALLLFSGTRELDIMILGDDEAMQIGVGVEAIRYRILIGASLLTGACVAVSGVIGFVGLVVPHMVRSFVGARHTPLFWGSILLGAVIMVWSDAVSRSLLPGGEEIPVGVITALLGGPVFFLILIRNRKARE